MMTRLLHLSSLFAVLITLVAADDPCRFEGPKGIIDLTTIARSDGNPAYPDASPSIGSNYLYSYNPCKSFSEGTCDNVALCQVSKDKQYTFTLGTQDTAKWDSGAGSNNPSISYSHDQKRALVELVCGPDGTNEFEALGEGPTNYFKFRLTNKCACWNGCGGTPPQQNCTVNGSTYTSDKQVIQSLPFPVAINPPQSQTINPTFSYANVDINSRVISLTLINVPNIPPALFCLNGMQELSILNSPAVSIPSGISRLSSSLKSFTVANISQSSSLPAELFTLNSLSSLSVINYGLETLSEDVSKLTALTQLTLDRNLLVSLPWSVGRLPALASLFVRNNPRLSSLDTLVGSTSLVTLRASNCLINHLPINIPNLSVVDLDGNQLRSLDGLETMAARNSSSLSFNNNQIATISSASLAKIATLHYFYLSNNLLTTLPDSLYLIKDMKVLYITNNKFDANEVRWIQGLFRLTNTTVFM